MREAAIVIGVDEAGRSALAGPLVVAATAFWRADALVTATVQGSRRRKVVSAGHASSISSATDREILDAAIRKAALAVAVVERSAKEIDARGPREALQEATQLAVARVLEELVVRGRGQAPAEFLVLLGHDVPEPAGLPCPVRAAGDGDVPIGPIGAASIVARVHRDARMQALHAKYPDWGFDRHKGYPTRAHRQVLGVLRPSPVHRKTCLLVTLAMARSSGSEE